MREPTSWLRRQGAECDLVNHVEPAARAWATRNSTHTASETHARRAQVRNTGRASSPAEPPMVDQTSTTASGASLSPSQTLPLRLNVDRQPDKARDSRLGHDNHRSTNVDVVFVTCRLDCRWRHSAYVYINGTNGVTDDTATDVDITGMYAYSCRLHR